MKYRTAFIATAFLVDLVSSALAIDENEIRTALQRHICPTQKIDTTGLPDLKSCERYGADTIAINKCQDHELSLFYRIGDYNKLYDACHTDYSSKIETQTTKSRDAEIVNRAERERFEGMAREGDESSRRTSSSAPRSPASQQQADSGWKCFPDYSSCTSYCRQQTGNAGNAGWCGGICAENGTGRMPKPTEYGSQRCFHAP
jgi:hypothetical protein